MNGPAMNLSGGWVLVQPSAVEVISRALAAAERLQRRDGYPPPPDFAFLIEAFAAAVQESRPSVSGRSEVPQQRGLPMSQSSARGVMADPVTSEQAAELLGCTARNVRDLCFRGAFESAQRNRSGWEIERAEVSDRVKALNSGASAPRVRSRGAAGWSAADKQARRGVDPHR